MSEEYEIIFITEEGRAIKNNKTGKIYHSEFEIIDEKNKEIDRLNNIINELEKWIEDNLGNCRTNQNYTSNQIYNLKEDAYYRCLNRLRELKENNKDV